MNTKWYFYILFASVMGWYGCKKSVETVPPNLGYSYFPLRVGSELIYQADSIGWLGYTWNNTTQSGEIDTVQFQIKEVVESFFTDNEGRETARVVRYKRISPSDPWTAYKVIAANLTPTMAQRVEDNIRYIKLVFPPRKNEKWNGNALDTIEPWEYVYDEVNIPGYAGPLYFDSTLIVTQINEGNLINYKFYTEQYAAGTGLIYKEYNDYEFSCIGCSKVKDGFIYKETLISSR